MNVAMGNSETATRPDAPDEQFDRSILRRIVEEVARVTGSSGAYIEHYEANGDARVIASAGQDVPEAGCVTEPATYSRARLTVPLNAGGCTVGAMVCVGAPRMVALDATQPGQIELLATLATAALRNYSLADELESATRAAIEQRFRLLNGLVHYLRNTLGAAGEYVQLIETEAPLSPRQQDYVAGSTRNIHSAVRLLGELLDLGRVETGRLPIQTQLLDPAAVVRGIARDYELANATIGVHFEVTFPQVLPSILADIDLVRRILDTLLSNAVRYAPPGSTIRITVDVRAGRRAGDAGSFVCINVRDQGPGVAMREAVFDEVLRAETVGSTPGFRLAIGRRIARMMGGDLSLDATLGNGASFSLWLPTC